MAVATKWAIRGSYFESCNCDPICPCRRIDGEAGGRSTHGVCAGILSWLIEDGTVDRVDLSGLSVALAFFYDDDESGSPWTWTLYLDDRASDEQAEALEAIFTGQLGGDALEHFPWAWKESNRRDTRRVAIELDHAPRRQWLRIKDEVTVRIHDRYPGESTVTCVIPGHEREGEELITDQLLVADEAYPLDFSGTCGYGSTFSYAG
jgi:hypothetical protein